MGVGGDVVLKRLVSLLIVPTDKTAVFGAQSFSYKSTLGRQIYCSSEFGNRASKSTEEDERKKPNIHHLSSPEIKEEYLLQL